MTIRALTSSKFSKSDSTCSIVENKSQTIPTDANRGKALIRQNSTNVSVVVCLCLSAACELASTARDLLFCTTFSADGFY